MRLPFAAFASASLLALVAACGGATSTDLFQDAAPTNDASSGNDGGGNDGGAKDARPDVTPANCKSLIDDVANKRDKALECNPGGNTPQCNALVADLCCPISVTDPTRKEVQEFAAAVEAVKKAGCGVACPAIPCPSTPSGKCDLKAAHCL